MVGTFFLPLSAASQSGATIDEWVRPTDWINISGVSNNEINLLVADGGVMCFSVTTADSSTYTIDWGDSIVETGCTSGSIKEHMFAVGSGQTCSLGYCTYKIRIYGASTNITRFKVERPTGMVTGLYSAPLLWVVFGTNNITSYVDAFYTTNILTCPMLSEVTISSFESSTSAAQCFRECYSLKRLNLPASWGIVTNLSAFLYYCESLQTVILPTSWGNVDNLTQMFYNCYTLSNLTLPTSWGNITTTNQLFSGCNTLSNIVLPTSWGVNTKTNQMFYKCNSMKTIVLPTSWGIVDNVSQMFYQCYGLQDINCGIDWGSSLLSTSEMFYQCTSLRSVTLPSTWNNINNVNNMFNGCVGLYKLNLPISWSGITNISYLFQGCVNLNTITLPASWGVMINATMMFGNCTSLITIDLGTSWGSGALLTTQMFLNCTALIKVVAPAQFGNIVNASSMFSGCKNLREIVNIRYIGSLTTQCNFTSFLNNVYYYTEPIIMDSLIGIITINGASNAIASIPSIIFTNTGSTYAIAGSYKINIIYTNLSRTALVDLFNILPTLTSKTINITGCTGTASLTADDRLIATNKGWTITG